MTHRWFLLLTLSMTACATRRSAAPHAVPQPHTANDAPPAVTGSDAPCLPLVSGCGCAYICASGFRRIDDRTYDVVHDLQDSRLDRATIERWCFDAAGHGAPARAANATMTRCRDVFFDGSPCGGECIPGVLSGRCEIIDGRCREPTGAGS